jgi:hypothetical protein
VKYLTIAILLMLTMRLPATSAQATDRITVLADTPGSCLKWIYIAEPELKRKKIDLTQYRFRVDEDKDVVYVIFTLLESRRALARARDKLGRDIETGYEIEIDKRTSKIIASYYER